MSFVRIIESALISPAGISGVAGLARIVVIARKSSHLRTYGYRLKTLVFIIRCHRPSIRNTLDFLFSRTLCYRTPRFSFVD